MALWRIRILSMSKNYTILVACALVVFGVVMRVLPHAPNMTPVTAIVFIGSLYIGRRWVFILPCIILLLSDMMMGMYDWRIMLSVYGSFVLIGCVGWISRKYSSLPTRGLFLASSSLLFFFITNSAVWWISPWYEKTITGLLYSYELGLPFLRNMFLGDVVYVGILVCVFEVVYLVRKVKSYPISAPPIYRGKYASENVGTFSLSPR